MFNEVQLCSINTGLGTVSPAPPQYLIFPFCYSMSYSREIGGKREVDPFEIKKLTGDRNIWSITAKTYTLTWSTFWSVINVSNKCVWTQMCQNMLVCVCTKVNVHSFALTSLPGRFLCLFLFAFSPLLDSLDRVKIFLWILSVMLTCFSFLTLNLALERTGRWQRVWRPGSHNALLRFGRHAYGYP